MAAPKRPPGPIDWMLRQSRALLDEIGKLVRHPELIAALNAELGIVHQPDAAAVAAAEAEIAAIKGELEAKEAVLGADTGVDDEVFDLLIGGKRFFTLVKLWSATSA